MFVILATTIPGLTSSSLKVDTWPAFAVGDGSGAAESQCDWCLGSSGGGRSSVCFLTMS